MKQKKLKKCFEGKDFFKGKFPFCIMKSSCKSCDYGPEQTYRRDFWKIVYITKGEGYTHINDRKYPLHAGSVFLIHPEDQTTYEIKGKSIHMYNLLFMPNFVLDDLKELSSDFNFFSIFYWSFSEAELGIKGREQLYIFDAGNRILKLLNSLYEEYETGDINSQHAIRHLLLLLLIQLNRDARDQVTKAFGDQVINYIEMYLQQHYQEDLSLKNLAKQVSMHPAYLCRLYRRKRNISIFNDLRRIRLEKAADCLQAGSLGIAEVCFSCGFNNLSYFYRAFRSKYNQSPGEFRKS